MQSWSTRKLSSRACISVSRSCLSWSSLSQSFSFTRFRQSCRLEIRLSNLSCRIFCLWASSFLRCMSNDAFCFLSKSRNSTTCWIYNGKVEVTYLTICFIELSFRLIQNLLEKVLNLVDLVLEFRMPSRLLSVDWALNQVIKVHYLPQCHRHASESDCTFH